MRYVAMTAAGICLLAMSATAGISPVSAAGASQASAPIVLAQVEPKKETLTHKIKRKTKRAWRNLTGYTFDIACPALLPMTHSTCTETGSRDEAMSKCQSRNVFCSVSEQR